MLRPELCFTAAVIGLLWTLTAWAEAPWMGAIESIRPTLGGTTVACSEIMARYGRTQKILDKILRLHKLIIAEGDLPPSARRKRRIDRWSRRQQELRSELASELPEEFQRRDQRVEYFFDAPRLADEIARAGEWSPLPGLRAIERIEVRSIQAGETSIDPIRPGTPALDPRGNEIPTSFRIERDPMGRESLVIRFHRHLSRIEVCTSDLSMRFELQRSVLVDLPGGGTRRFSGQATLVFPGVTLQ